MTLKHATAATGVARDHHHFRNPVTGKVERALLVEPALSSLVRRSIPSLKADARPDVVRNDTATEFDENGVIQSVAVNKLRNQHYLTDNTSTSRRVTLLERAYTNLVTSDDFDAGWASSGTPVITSGISDPAGGTSAYTIADDDGAAGEWKQLAITFTGDGVKSAVWIVKEATMASSGNQTLRVRQTSGTAATKLELSITSWSSGEPQVTAVTGTHLGTFEIGNGFYAVVGQTTSVVAAETNVIYVHPAFTAAATGSITIYRAMAFNAAVPPASILSASEATTADSFTVDLLDSTPQEATYLYEGVVLDLPGQGTVGTLFNVGVATGSARLYAYFNSTNARIYIGFHNGTSTVEGYWSNTVALGDYIAIRLYQASDGAITAGLKINSAAEDTTLDGAIGTQALPGAWTNPSVIFSNATAGGASPANSGLISFKAQSGAEKTLAEMQALTGADIAYYSTYADAERPAIGTGGGGAPIGEATAEAVTASAEGITLPYDSSLGTTIVKLTTGAAGSQTRRYRFGSNANIAPFTANQLAAMVVGVYIPTSSEVGYADVKLVAVDDVGETVGMAAPGDGDWHWLLVARTWDAAATAAYFELRFADGVNLSGADEVLYMALPTAVDDAAVGAPIANATDAASTATGADTVYDTSPDSSLVAQTIYLRGYEVGTAKAGGTIYHLGSGVAGADPRVIIEATGGVYRAKLDDGTEEVTSAMATAPSPGQLFELRLEILSTGSIQLHQSINAATETDAAASAVPAGGLPTALAGDRRYFGSEAGSTPGTLVLTHEARLPGSVSLACCRAFCGL